MQLPDIDGLEVLRRLKGDPEMRDLRIVALSVSAMPEDVAQARALGVAAYWTKPLDFDRFPEDVAHAIETAPAAQLASSTASPAWGVRFRHRTARVGRDAASELAQARAQQPRGGIQLNHRQACKAQQQSGHRRLLLVVGSD
jgi:CheY-like chemotaxis protein